jgi:exopolyphosphatase / guanosine-5'-triphosphate,3'-diphosphate pyrophosphatase
MTDDAKSRQCRSQQGMNSRIDRLQRIGVIDLGSNSLRLAVFENAGGALFALLNEKVMCGLARGISTTGRLDRAGLGPALVNLRRFSALARATGVEQLVMLATAAVRDASDGPAFAAEVERSCDVPVKILEGAEEARLSALGALAGIPDADGIVADLGAGSIELVEVGPAVAEDGGPGAIGAAVSLPLGPLRLGEFADNPRAAGQAVRSSLATAPFVAAATGRSLYLVGGASRAIARLHMEHIGYPLHIVHQYRLGRAEAEGFFELVGGLSRRTLERIVGIPKKRLETVPLAAFILRQLMAVTAPKEIVFSAFGLREGYAWSLLPEAERRQDPLLSACAAIARKESRFSPDGARLQRWVSSLFPNIDEASRRLHEAASWLSDIGWNDHPDSRAEQACTRSLRLPLPAITHAERAFIGAVLHTRYGGNADHPVRAAAAALIEPWAAGEVRALGLALRLACTMCGGATHLLSGTRIAREGGRLILQIPANGLFGGETVERRLDGLGRALGLDGVLTRVAP